MHLTVVFVVLHAETHNLPSKGPKICKQRINSSQQDEINMVRLKQTTLQKNQNDQPANLQSIGTDQPLLILDRKVEVLGDGKHSNSHRGTRNYKTQVYHVWFVVS